MIGHIFLVYTASHTDCRYLSTDSGWDSRYYYLPYNILANLFEISKQYGDAERVYLQLIEVMLVNEYTEDSPTIIQFREKAAELHQLALTT